MKTNYIKTRLQSLINISKIVVMHYYEVDSTFIFKGEKHDFWEMIYVDKGKVEIKSDEDVLVLKQGELAFHAPNEFHSVKAFESSPNFFVFSFECTSSAMEYFRKFHTQLGKDLKPYISSIINEAHKTFVIPKNDVSLKKLNLKPNATIGGEQMIKTLLEQLFILLIRQMTERKNPSVFPSKETMESHLSISIKNYVSERVFEIIKVSDVCTHYGYSKTYLCKVFKEQSGYTINEYVNKIKINKAKELIREHRLNFSEISSALAYDNPQYFTRVFKRVTSMTPTEFKDSLNIIES